MMNLTNLFDSMLLDSPLAYGAIALGSFAVLVFFVNCKVRKHAFKGSPDQALAMVVLLSIARVLVFLNLILAIGAMILRAVFL